MLSPLNSIFGRTNVVYKRVVLPTIEQKRTMATLKDIKLRIKSVSSISKLTKTMQMVASSKMRVAIRQVENTKHAANSVNRIFEGKEIEAERAGSNLIINVTSDKGMCGPINNQIVRHTKNILRGNKEFATNAEVAQLGSKGVPAMIAEFPKQFVLSLKDFGRKEYSFLETGFVVDQLLSDRDYNSATVIYNRFKNALTYIVTEVVVPGPATLEANAGKFNSFEFDEDQDATFKDLFEYQLAMSIWSASMQNRASEFAARMTSMDNATKNANSIISLLSIQYNRGRQAAITTELIEITSGANAIGGAL